MEAAEALRARARGGALARPSLSAGATPLFAHGAYEAETAANLHRPLAALLAGAGWGGDGAVLTVNDPALPAPARVRVRFEGAGKGGLGVGDGMDADG